MKIFLALPLAAATLFSLPGVRGAGESVKDVLLGSDVELQCRFSPGLAADTATLYWIRSTNDQHDNVAIGNTPYSTGYTVEHKPELGRYDLRIKNASYERDNGNFECRNVEFGTGRKLHSSVIQLVVLLPPSPPTISPLQPTVTEGKQFNLTCASTGGSPPPQISWYRVGEPDTALPALELPGRTRAQPSQAVLAIVPRKEDDASDYRCTVWNRAMPETELMETSTSINVNYYPRVTVGPENPIRVERDETAELYCEVDSKPKVHEVRWMRDGRFVQTNFRHLIPRANLKDAGPYICSADNGLGQVGKAEVVLDVLYRPEVTVPARKEVEAGQEVVVSCEVAANPRATSIVWSKAGEPGWQQSGPTLRLAGSEPAATTTGQYTCTATNHLHPTGRQREQRTGNATISVFVQHGPGQTSISPANPTAYEGRAVTLECAATPAGYPQPTYRWWKAGSENTVLARGSKFTIDSVTLASAGKYYCQPSNDFGSGSKAEVELQVFQEPVMISQLQPMMTKRAGDRGFSVICSARGKPEPTVRWFKDGVEIQPASSDYYQVSGSAQENPANEAITVLSTLKFMGEERIHKDQLMPTDRGHYTCQFENEVARTESPMQLQIEHSPVVRHLHNKVAADLGEPAFISCKMQAFPRLSFEWSKGNSHLTERSQYKISMAELEDDIYEGVLQIERVEESSYDEYTCKAQNQMGAQRTIIRLQPKGKPEQPLDVRPVYTGWDTISLEWIQGFNGGYNQTTHNVEYKKIGGGSTRYHDCVYKNPCNISGLEQHTTYQFKVKAVNIRGDSGWSRDIKITTAVDVAKIPEPANVYYETSTNSVAFNVIPYPYPLGLVAKIELEQADGSWTAHAQLGMKIDLPYGQMPIEAAEVRGLRVQLCLASDPGLCGAHTRAEIVEVREAPLTSARAGLPVEAGIAIAVVVAVIIAVGAVCLVGRYRCGAQAKPKKLTKEDIAGPNRLQPNHNAFNYGLDNKGVDTAKDSADSPDLIKAQMYGYSYPPVPAAQVPNTVGYDSTSNSANGGSVNSQDSLWNVKHPNGEPMGTNGYIAAGYYGETQYQHQPTYQQHPQHPQHPQTQHPQHPQQQQQHTFEDYTHYPHPEEYLNDRNRGYFANGDQYAMPNKPRQRLESDYSPYGDVSGLPDPYTGHDISAELRQQGGEQGISLHSHDSQLEGSHNTPEGYSTPSRRVIREIIV